jgi:uncharacterized membrane protein
MPTLPQVTLPSWFGPFAARPRLVFSAAGGIVGGLAAHFLVGLQPSTAAIVGWDVLCAAFIASMLWSMVQCSIDQIRGRAEEDDEGRAIILTVVLVATVVAIAAVALELSLAKNAHGLERGLRVGLAFVTVAASWFMAHLIFAVHYAHGFYSSREPGASMDAGGLHFPGGQEPDYWDFLHFAVIIGVAAQTADIEIASKPLRRLCTVHALFSFAFNTVIVALTINLLAGLFG